MKHIRKGNDIHIKWAIEINDGTVSLSDVDIVVELRDSVGKIIQLEHTVSDNKYIEADFYGKYHDRLGEYTITAWINKGRMGQAVLDETDAFCLVRSSYETHGSDLYNVQVDTLEFSSAMAIGVQGKPGKDGKSAYQSWLDTGHVGTEDVFVNWLKGNTGKSAYQSWLDNGHEGTEDDFLNWLKAKSGIEEAPSDGEQYVRINGDWNKIASLNNLELDEILV